MHDYKKELTGARMTWSEGLTTEEVNAVEEFKKRTIKDVTPKMLEDETLFYRFMKARDFNLQNAELMLRNNIIWRKEHQVDTILTDYKAPSELIKYFPVSFVGFDKEGCLIKYIDLGGADSKGVLCAFRKTDIVKLHIQIMEEDLERLKEQSKKLGRRITKVVHIYDWNKTTFAKVTNKMFFDFMLLSANMYQDNYPERIKFMFQINVSIYFSMIFSLLKPALAAQLLEKIKIYGSDGWKEVLLKVIDDDVLPAFLGGTRTDPDGNPLCKNIIRYGVTVPESMYLRKSEKKLYLSPGVKKLKVTRFAKSEIVFEVNEPNSLLEWEFETKNKDIGFGVYFKANEDGESKVIPLVPKQRIDTCIEPETGIYKCELPGTYIVIFDNSYSWIYPKEIYYRTRIISPNEERHIEWT